MLTKLRLQNFKNFKNAELHLGKFTLLIGTNASGKSNLREAFRFLHGISRGYNLAEILGEKYSESGIIQWRGIRGGTREVAFQAENSFALDASCLIQQGTSERESSYRIEVNLDSPDKTPYIVNEKLANLFEAKITIDSGHRSLIVTILEHSVLNRPIPFIPFQPVVSQLAELATDVPIQGETLVPATSIRGKAKATLEAFHLMRFLDLNPDAMRIPSLPGQTTLGDRGENLSSVVQSICVEPQSKQALIQWLQELTPMDVVDFEFPADFTGKILLTLIEGTGQKISAISASDGTLRFLAIIVALLASKPNQLYFFEELDNGIHPTRLNLLIQFIEHQVNQKNIQVVATTHSPQLLRLLSQKSLESACLTYRFPDRLDAKIKRLLDIPDAQGLIEEQDLARLHESGWLEDAVYFLEEEETVV